MIILVWISVSYWYQPELQVFQFKFHFIRMLKSNVSEAISELYEYLNNGNSDLRLIQSTFYVLCALCVRMYADPDVNVECTQCPQDIVCQIPTNIEFESFCLKRKFYLHRTSNNNTVHVILSFIDLALFRKLLIRLFYRACTPHDGQ